MTESERRLWSGLRGKQLGYRFRRQHPFGCYIADFACLAPKLIIELDGSQHALDPDHDARRDLYFRAHGFTVLRFPTDAPLRHPDAVRSAILEELNNLAGGAPTPTLPRRGRA